MDIKSVFAGLIFPQIIYLSKFKILFLRNIQYFGTFVRIYKFAFGIKQLQCVPLFWVMRCCKDNTAMCLQFRYHNLYSRCGGKSEVHYMYTKSLKRGCNQRINHGAGDACIAANNKSKIFPVVGTL